MIRNVGLDLGNSVTNVVTDKLQYSFLSHLSNGYDKFSEVEKIHAVYEDTDYSIGIGENNINKSKYFTNTYKIMFLTALAKSSKEKEIEINVVFSLPVDDFKNDNLKNRIKNEISGWGTQRIIVDGSEKLININSFDIWVEGGIIISDMQKYENQKIIVVDIGGYTWDILGFENNKRTATKTEKKGIITLKEEIYKSFKEDNNIDLDESSKNELFYAVKKNETYEINNKVLELKKYNKFIDNYTNNIFNEIEKTFYVSDKKIIFIGGGSLELEPFLKPFKSDYNFEVVKNGNYLNAKANYDYATKILCSNE